MKIDRSVMAIFYFFCLSCKDICTGISFSFNTCACAYKLEINLCPYVLHKYPLYILIVCFGASTIPMYMRRAINRPHVASHIPFVGYLYYMIKKISIYIAPTFLHRSMPLADRIDSILLID